MPTASRKNAPQESEEPQQAPAEPAEEAAPDPLRRVLLEYIGDTKIVIPFGELTAGEVVAVPHEMAQLLIDQGMMRTYSGDPVDQDKIRHP